MSSRYFIVWDLGATKCGAALVKFENGEFIVLKKTEQPLYSFSSLIDLTNSIEKNLNIEINQSDAVCIAGAGQYNGRELILDKAGHVGYPFPMQFKFLSQRLNWKNFWVIHDYTPIICRTFIDSQNEIFTIHPGTLNPLGRRVAFGVGTGLGLKDAVLLPNNQIWIGTNEMGHIGLCHPPSFNQEEFQQHQALINFIQKKNQEQSTELTFETILTGPGLSLLYQFTENLSEPLSPEETSTRIVKTGNTKALELFAHYLGLFIGVVQLTFMPSGGIWMSGGVLHKNLHLFEEPMLSHLKRGILLSPAYQPERNQFSLKIMLGLDHAFLGGAFFLLQQLEQKIWC